MEKIDLKEGDKAPLFKLDSFNMGTVDLAELIGEQKIVLIFSRYFGCPICLVDLNELLNRKKDIMKKGAIILYITQSGEKIALEIPLDWNILKYWNIDKGNFEIEPGEYELLIGSSSSDIRLIRRFSII